MQIPSYIMKIKILFLFFLFFFKNSIYSQTTISSLEDSIKINIYSKPQKTIVFSHKYLKLNQEKNDTEKIKVAYSVLAVCHELINQTDSVLYYYHKRLSLAKNPLDIYNNKFYIARIYNNNYNYNEALRLYGQMIDLAKQEGNDLMVKDTKLSIELLKMKVGLNKSGLSEDMLSYLERAYNEYKDVADKKTLHRYNRRKLIEVYLHQENLVKASPLINEGIQEAIEVKNLIFLYYMYEFRSRSNLLENNLENSKADALEAKRYAIQLSNNKFIDETNYRLAEIAFENKKYKEALLNLKSILSNNIAKSSFQSSKYYKLTASVYKNLDSIKLSNTFYSKYIEEREKVAQEYLSALESIHDITLKEELSSVQDSYKEELQLEINEKEKLKKTKWVWTIISAILLISIVTLVLFFRNKSKVNQKRFDNLMIKIKDFEERKTEENRIKPKSNQVEQEPEIEQVLLKPQEVVEVNETEEIEEEIDATYTIDDKKVEEILIKLQKLEDKHYFLRQDCTLHNMAKKLKTNTSYLSKIINTHLDKSFSTYINELRINYAILELKNNRRIRSYSVKGIAQEMGYKNADAFSRYFRAATGITPSVYIKKIQEI